MENDKSNFKVRINGIFGKYNNEIDLSNKCNILIGENGIGKSTCIKILNCLFNYNYIELLKYYFESIELISNNDSIIIKYEDIAISKDYILKKYCGKDYKQYMEFEPDFEEFDKKYNTIPMEAVFDDNIDEEYKKKWDKYSFYYNFDRFNKRIDYRLIYKILKKDKNILSNESLVTGIVDSEYYIYHIWEMYDKEKINSNKSIFYTHSNISKKYKQIENMLKRINYQKAIMINMASDFDVKNDLNRSYIENKEEIEVLNEAEKNLKQSKRENKKITFGIFKQSAIIYKDINEKYPGLQNKQLIEKLKDNYKVIREEGLDNNKIDLGYYIFNQIYNDKFINEFKNDLYNFLNENINNISKDIQEFQITNKYFNKIKVHLKPLLDKDNIFYDKLDIDYKELQVYGQEFELLLKFIEKYKDKYIDIQNEKLIKLNYLFKKYFTNKEIIATPFGISISTKDYGNDIYFEELSAGEQKIIILLTISVFSDNLIILLDEPETSLSIIWQEQLIPDLVENTKFKNIVVATQSPYIVRSDELLNNIVYLPTKEI